MKNTTEKYVWAAINQNGKIAQMNTETDTFYAVFPKKEDLVSKFKKWNHEYYNVDESNSTFNEFRKFDTNETYEVTRISTSELQNHF